MSSMQLQLVIRFEVEPRPENKSKDKSVLDYAKEFFRKEPDFVEDDYAEYLPEENGGFTFNVINDKMFIDYIISEERDCYDIDKDVTEHDLQQCALSLVYRFVKDNPNNPIIVNQKVKILYYYNGGCGGISEVE